MKRASDYIVNLFLRGLIASMLLLPYPWRVRAMGWFVERVIAPIAGYRKRIRNNLAHVLPDLPEQDVERLCRQVPNNAGRVLIEFYSGAQFVERAKRAPISGPGLAAMDRAHANGQSVILVSGHFGNYDAGRAALIARGLDLGGLYRRMSNPFFNDHYVKSIETIGTPLFEQGRKGMSQMIRHIKSGGDICILTDIHAYGGAPLTFFGKTAISSLATAELALKYNAVLFPTYAKRADNGLDFEITVDHEIPPSDSETMTQAINDSLEAMVRENMHQWFWIHRRWKNT